MNTTFRVLALIGAAAFSTAGLAGPLDLADKPLASGASVDVKPNVFFILDDSGSMGWDYLPDGVSSKKSSNCFKNHLYNRVYFNPDYAYPLPVDASGNPYPAPTFADAWKDGYKTSDGKTVLSSAFKAHSSDTAQAAYYYEYTGGGTPTEGTCYADSKYTKRVVTAAQQQNFANWYSYYRTRMQMMKSGVTRAFKTIGSNYRVGFTTISDTGATDNSTFQHIDDFNTTQKSTWYSKLVGTQPSGFTPLRGALAKAGKIYAKKLGSNDPMQYSCQQNFTILSTDGYWNTDDETASYGPDKLDNSNVNNQDGTAARPMWDGTSSIVTKVDTYQRYVYSTTTSGCFGGKRRLRKQEERQTITTTTTNGVEGTPVTSAWNNYGSATYPVGCSSPAPALPSPSTTDAVFLSTNTNSSTSGGNSNSLADVAMYYYETDLRDGALSNCTGALGNDVCENNVPGAGKDTNTKQHMTTFTIGLGVDGTLNYSEDYESGGSSDYTAIVQGTKNWPDPISNTGAERIDDLWHAAVNGRGTYFSAQTPEGVASGLTKALSGVSARTGSGAAAATSTLQPIQGDNYAFVALYTTVKWTGDIQRRDINLSSGEVSTTPSWSAQTQLDAMVNAADDSRTIYTPVSGALKTFVPGNLTAAKTAKYFNADSTNPNGALSQYGAFSAEQQAQATPDSIINYIRGQYGLEDRAANTYRLYREREHVLGDIVNGAPAYVRKPVFQYTDSGYSAYQSAKASRTPVVYTGANDGMLHAINADTGDELWAFVPSAVVPYLYKLADKTYADNHRFYVDGPITVGDAVIDGDWRTVLVGGLGKGGRGYYALDVTNPTSPTLLWEYSVANDSDLGYTYGNAQITKLNGGDWVVMFASGYNNTSPGDGKARLYVLDVKTGAKLKEIIASDETDPAKSGLAMINGWVDSPAKDNSTRHVYAGDMEGHVWRFDLVDGTATLLATIGKVVGASTQPITTKPELGEVPEEGLTQRVIYVGTGRYYGISDITDNSMQSFYAIRDDAANLKSWGNFRADPTVVAMDLTGGAGSRNLTYSAVAAADAGWYVDFDAENGERVTVNPRLSFGYLTVLTNVPSEDLCVIGGTSWAYFFDAYPSKAGAAPAGTIAFVGNALAVGASGIVLPSGKQVTIANLADGTNVSITNQPTTSSGTLKRVTWRELIN